jgi:glutamyl-tRNA(Gln) amidotransferase subunit E
VKVGLEVHQQLSVGKLFCACPARLSEQVESTIVRRLRPTGGENLAVDPAVAFEAARGLTFRYETTDSDCLVEADEEPPHAIHPDALEVALVVAELLHAHPLDEIEVMRKIVIDGSNTSGFQRTTLVAIDGYLELDGKRYTIPTICLEEDSARRVGEREGEVRYRLDRLGIPLIEVATGPDIESGPEARAVAEEIGAMLRATRRVRRGIGSIREDLNVSTPGGVRIEIKGVQELRLIQRYVEVEEERQRRLLAVREELRRRGRGTPSGPGIDLGDLLSGVTSGPFRGTGGTRPVALGLRLPGFAGLLRGVTPDGERLGRELADQARSQGLRGLVHSDELPAYGIDEAVVALLRRRLECADDDAFVLLSAPNRERAEGALAAVRARAVAALDGIPPETRDPLPDGRSRYSRPLPGRDRMYPETDVPSIRPRDRSRTPAQLPELPRQTRERIARTYDLNPEIVLQLIRSDSLDQFETLVGEGFAAPTVARLLAQDLPEAMTGLPEPVRPVELGELESVLRALAEGRFAKEGVGRILHEMLAGGGGVDAAIAKAGLAPLSREELERLVEGILDENESLLRARGERAESALMGDVMRQVRGRRDGKEVAEVLRAAVHRRADRAAT